MEDEMPLVPEMSPEEKQILADLEWEKADAETKDAINDFLLKSCQRLVNHHSECRPKQVHKHVRELADQLKECEAVTERVHARVSIDPAE